MGGQQVVHSGGKTGVIAFCPVPVQAQAILGRAQGEGGMKIGFGHGRHLGISRGGKSSLSRLRAAAAPPIVAP
jgi:hypothetical protein